METLILRSLTKSLINGTSSYDWNLVEAKRDPFGKLKLKHTEISRAEAREIIEDKGFKIIFKTDYGLVYGDEDESFKNNLGPFTEDELSKIGRW